MLDTNPIFFYRLRWNLKTQEGLSRRRSPLSCNQHLDHSVVCTAPLDGNGPTDLTVTLRNRIQGRSIIIEFPLYLHTFLVHSHSNLLLSKLQEGAYTTKLSVRIFFRMKKYFMYIFPMNFQSKPTPLNRPNWKKILERRIYVFMQYPTAVVANTSRVLWALFIFDSKSFHSSHILILSVVMNEIIGMQMFHVVNQKNRYSKHHFRITYSPNPQFHWSFSIYN